MLGDPRKAVTSMSGPLIISFLIVQINGLADSAWCSTLGDVAASAVSTIFPFYWIISGVGTGIGVGAAAAIARHLGRKERGTADSLVAQTMFASVVIGLVMMPVVYLLLGPTIDLVGASDVKQECLDYIVPMVLCSLPIVVNGAVAGTLRAEGAARRSTVVLLVTAILNMILDPLLIIVLDIGAAGAGWASGISSLLAALIGLWWYLRGSTYLRMSFKGFRPIWSQIWEVLYVGIPKIADSTLISVMCLLQRIFVIYCGGTIGVMLFNVPWKFVTLAQAVSQAVGSALVPVASAALGVKDLDKAEAANRCAMRLSLAIMIVVAVVLFVFADWAVIPLTMSDSLVEYRGEMAYVLRVYALLIPLMAFVDIGASILQSLRRAQHALLSSFLRNVVMIAFIAVACTISMNAIYWSVMLAEIAGAAIAMWLASREYRKVRRKILAGEDAGITRSHSWHIARPRPARHRPRRTAQS